MVRGRHGWRRARWPGLGLGGVAAVIAVVVVMAAVGQAGGRACAATVSAGGTVSAARTVSAAGTVAGMATHYVLSGTGLGLLAQNTGNPAGVRAGSGPLGEPRAR